MPDMPEAAKIKRDGISIDKEEHTVGVFCLAATILVEGRPLGAVGITGRALDPLMGHVRDVQHAAEVISHVLSRGV